MKYRNGKDVLPPELLDEIQKYVHGEMLYIPKRENTKEPWGNLSGQRLLVNNRNSIIKESYKNGVTVNELIDEFCLSEASIRKIIYS